MGGLKDEIKIKDGDVSLHINLIGYVDNDEDIFYFYSPALDLYSTGNDEIQAKEAFEEVLFLFIDFIMQNDTYEQELKKLGWKRNRKFKKKYKPPTYDVMELMRDKGVNSFSVSGQELAVAH